MAGTGPHSNSLPCVACILLWGIFVKNNKGQVCFRAIVLLGLLPLVACIASAPGSGGGQQQPIQVTVTASVKLPASVPVDTTNAPSTIQFGATLTGTSNQAVTWGAPTLGTGSTSSASGSGLGTIDSNGLYTAPTTIPDCPAGVTPCELQVVITATSQANTSYSGQALVNIHVIITMTPPSDTIGQGAYLQFTTNIVGTGNQAVNWQAACTACASGQGGGSVDPNNAGLYIAPPFQQGVSTPQTVTVSATSSFDPTQVASAVVTVDQSDPLGSATPGTAGGAEIPCPTFGGGLAGATCYQINTSCDQVADYSVYLKVNTPTNPLGTVLFGTGSGGSALYDYDSPDFFYMDGGGNTVNGGLTVVQGVLSAGYTTVQISFGSPFNTGSNAVNGWLQGPGGVRHLACRYATVAQWVYENIHNSSTTKAFCATANSGGSGALGYALSEYGLNSIFNMMEPTSGPVMTRLDLGCSPQGSNSYGGTTACANPPNLDMSYSPGSDGTAGIIDTAYQSVGSDTPTLCSDGVNGVTSANFLRFESDSIDFSPSKSPALPISGTTLNVLFGGQDGSNAVGQGEWWWKSVGPPPTQACEPNAPHAIPADPTGAGAAQIVTDIQNLCVVPAK